jgi:hypothetical protein
MSLNFVSLERLNHYYIGMIPNNQYSSLHFQNGITALMLSTNSSLTEQEVVSILQNTAIDMGSNGFDYDYGYGRLNAFQAIQEVLPLMAGTNIVCSSENTYSLNNLPQGTTVTWTSSSNIIFPSGNTGSSISARAYSSSSSGSGWIEATINGVCGDITLPRKEVWVGKPSTPQITCPLQTVGLNSFVEVSASSLGATYYNWSIGGGSLVHGQGMSEALIKTSRVCQYDLYIRVRGENTCGFSSYAKKWIDMNCGGDPSPVSVNPDLLDGVELNSPVDTSSNVSDATISTLTNDQLDSESYKVQDFIYMSVHPNPANAYAEINFYTSNELSDYKKESKAIVSIPSNRLIQNGGEYKVKIWHERYGLVKQMKSSSKKLQIPTNNLDEGIYFLHVIVNGKVYKQKLKIQR